MLLFLWQISRHALEFIAGELIWHTIKGVIIDGMNLTCSHDCYKFVFIFKNPQRVSISFSQAIQLHLSVFTHFIGGVVDCPLHTATIYYYYFSTWRINLLTIYFMVKWSSKRSNGMWKQQITISLEFVSCRTWMAGAEGNGEGDVELLILVSLACPPLSALSIELFGVCLEKHAEKRISSNDYGNNDDGIGGCVQTYHWTKSIRPLVNFNAVSFHLSSVFWHSNRCKYLSGSMRSISTCTHRIPILRIDFFCHFGWIRAIDNARQSFWPLRFGSRTVRCCLGFLRWMKWIIAVSRIFEHRKNTISPKKRT